MDLLRLVLRWQSRKAAVEHEVVRLMTFLGDMAYSEARTRARACRTKGDREGDRLWSRGAVTIAKRSGYEIGLKAADRYEQDASPRERERARRPHEIATRTTAILSVLAEIARDREVETGSTMSAPMCAMRSTSLRRTPRWPRLARRSASPQHDWRMRHDNQPI